MNPVKVAVIGCGHLGRIHTKLLCEAPGFEVVGVADPNSAARDQVEQQFDLLTYADYRSLMDRIDAAVVASPTFAHFDAAAELLLNGIHTFVEKPLTSCSAQAQRLLQIADQQKCVLQVGHVERFNPAYQAALEQVGHPRYFESERTSGYTFRSTDIGVVFDLMIHDIDLVLAAVDSPLANVRASGISIFGRHEDIAEARLEFANGAIANLNVI